MLKIVRRAVAIDRSVSFVETAGKDKMIQSLRSNIIESGAHKNGKANPNDNFEVVVDTKKDKMKITKRGQATIAMKVNDLPLKQSVADYLVNYTE